MGLSKLRGKLGLLFKKNKYIVLILIIGLLFMLIPGMLDSQKTNTTDEIIETKTEPIALDERLESILDTIDGVGKVKVLLTVATGEETIYQTDTDTNTSNDTHTVQIETVLLSNTDRSQCGMIRQVNPPTYRGAIIICEGANSASVRFAVIEAVAKVTGLGTDRICVLKMK